VTWRAAEKNFKLEPEAFGLDTKIGNDTGARPISLYRWDLECHPDAIDVALEEDYPDKGAHDFPALNQLGE
jgi:hypothetical protein